MLTELQNNLNTIHSEIMEKLIPENIKKDVTILNVTGTLEQEEGVDTSDATATSADLINPKTAYVNGEKIVGNINKSTADAIIGTSDDAVEEFRTNILNALSGHMNADESGINYDLYPQKYGTGDTSLDKPVNIYFVYENSEENCYDIIAIMTGNWNIKRNSNAGWNASVSRTEHYVTTTNGTDWRNGVWFYHYRVNYNFEFVSKVTKSKDKTAVWGDQSMNVLFGINSCLYENLLLVSPNYLSRMISNVSSFAVYEDKAGHSSYPSLNEELNLILNEKNTKIIPENFLEGLTILNVKGAMPNNGTLNYTPSTEEQIIPKGYTDGGVIAAIEGTGSGEENAVIETTFTYNLLVSHIVKIPPIDTSNLTTAYSMFQSCKKLIAVPQMDTSNVTNMRYMFQNCVSLETIPLLDTSKVTDMQLMVSGCTKLTNESLNNILLMCANAVAYTATNTLKYLGLSQEQINTCQTLSNYQALIDAGWTTGY